MAAAAVEDPVVPNDDDDAVVDEQERRRRDRQAAMERMLLAQEQRDADTEDNLAAENPAQMGRVDPEGDGVAAAAAAAAEDAVANNDNDLQVQLLNQHQQHQHQAQLQEQQPKTLRALSYTQTSFCAAGALLYYALRTRQQWYLALVYLSSSKLALVVMFNALTAGAVTSFDIVTNTFLSGLRLQEAEGLQDFFRWNVTETCLALTMFRSELSASTAVQFLILVTVKCLHHVAILREQHVRMTEDAIVETTFGIGGIKLALIPLQHVKLLAMLVFLQLVDIMALQFTVQDLLTNGPTVSVLFAFEAAILLVAAWSHILLWYLHVTDSWLNYNHERAPTNFFGRMLHPWKEYKATLIFAVELQAQLIQFIFYMVFFSVAMTYYGVPINLLREVYVSFLALKDRLWAFLKYRQLMASMNRFADVTDEQLDEAGRTCIICRDEMHKEDCKQLPACQHLFHKSCLREWLCQQQTCPTCRSDISTMDDDDDDEDDEHDHHHHHHHDNAVAADRNHVEEPEAQNGDPVDEHGAWEENEELQDDNNSDSEGEENVIEFVDYQDISHSEEDSASRRDKKVRFIDQSAADNDYHSLPALFRVVREAGAPVWNVESDAPFEIRSVPFGVVVLCKELKEQSMDGAQTVMLRIPDGWIPEDSVLHVHSLK